MPALSDLPLKDQQEVIERLFFSLQQRTRIDGCDHRVGVAIMIGALDLD